MGSPVAAPAPSAADAADSLGVATPSGQLEEVTVASAVLGVLAKVPAAPSNGLGPTVEVWLLQANGSTVHPEAAHVTVVGRRTALAGEVIDGLNQASTVVSTSREGLRTALATFQVGTLRNDR